MPGIVIAGIGNSFHGDDGFGPAVARALAQMPPTSDSHDVTVIDAGVRTMHLAYDIADDVDLLVVADLLAHVDPAPAVSAVELDDVPPAAADGHGMGLDQVLALARQLGRGPRRTIVVGCAPHRLTGDGLSPDVADAVAAAARFIRTELDRWVCELDVEADRGGGSP